jgi:hypothetical protein
MLYVTKNQSSLPGKSNPIQTKEHEEEKTSKQVKQAPSSKEESEDDPLLKEGYLPEIYFSLKSDNPADW